MKRWLVISIALLALAPATARPDGVTVARVRVLDAVPRGRPVEDRLGEIRRRIQAALVYPELARRRGQEGEVWMRFTIDARGSATELETVRPSGRWLLDRAAERAVRDAAPLPFVWGRLEVPVYFELGVAPDPVR